MGSRASDREETGEKRAEMWGIPGLGIGIINRLADNLRQEPQRSIIGTV